MSKAQIHNRHLLFGSCFVLEYVCVRMYESMYVCIYIYVYIYAYVYVFIHIYRQVGDACCMYMHVPLLSKPSCIQQPLPEKLSVAFVLVILCLSYLWLVGNGRMVVMVLIIVPIPPFPTNQR